MSFSTDPTRENDDSLLDCGVKHCIVDPPWPLSMSDLDKYDYGAFNVAVENWHRQKGDSANFHPFYAASTPRFQESYYLPLDAEPFDWCTYELARIAVPHKNIGILRSIDQAIFDFYSGWAPTGAEYWGRPYFNDVDYLQLVSWYLRIEDYNGTLPPRFINVSPVATDPYRILPGQAWSEMPEINGLWYPANAPSNKISLYLPENSLLRFFVHQAGPTGFQFAYRYSGRLRAQILSSSSSICGSDRNLWA